MSWSSFKNAILLTLLLTIFGLTVGMVLGDLKDKIEEQKQLKKKLQNYESTYLNVSGSTTFNNNGKLFTYHLFSHNHGNDWYVVDSTSVIIKDKTITYTSSDSPLEGPVERIYPGLIEYLKKNNKLKGEGK